MLNPLHGADPRHKAKLVAFPIGICTLERVQGVYAFGIHNFLLEIGLFS